MKTKDLVKTARALAKLNQAGQPYPIDHLHAYTLTRRDIERLIKHMSQLSSEALADMPGMNEERVDVILPGAIVIDELMKTGHFETLTISGSGVREGVFFEQFLSQPTAKPVVQHLRHAPTLKNPRRFAVDNLALQYGQGTRHAAHVRKLAVQLFDQLSEVHGYGVWERELLANAALLHDVGYIVNYYNHDKHSEYLIADSELPGFNPVQDYADYDVRTHHTNMDTFERVMADDLKQCAIVLASFAYHAAMRAEKIPVKSGKP